MDGTIALRMRVRECSGLKCHRQDPQSVVWSRANADKTQDYFAARFASEAIAKQFVRAFDAAVNAYVPIRT